LLGTSFLFAILSFKPLTLTFFFSDQHWWWVN